jgi:hypothetical protein
MLPAQKGANPGFSRKPQPSWIILNSFNSVPGTDIQQIFHCKLPTDKDGRWTTCVTVAKLPKFFGGDDQSTGIVMGIYAPYEGFFDVGLVPVAKLLNSTGRDANLTLDPSGLWAIFDRDDGVYVAKRSGTTASFAAPTKVQGFGALRDVMPALGPVGGKMKVFYTDRTAIQMQDIDLAGAKLVGSPTVVSRPLQANAKPLRPTPLIGGDGDVEGLFLAEEVKPHTKTNTGDADPVFAFDLDPATPPIMHVNRTDWQPGGSPAGGFLSFGHDISPRFHLMHSEIALLLGDNELIGGTADIKMWGTNHSHPKPLVSAVFFSLGTIPKVPIPNINGWLGLLPPILGDFGTAVHKDKEGSGLIRIPIPNAAFLRGLILDLQAIVVDPVKGQITFTNTAPLQFR